MKKAKALGLTFVFVLVWSSVALGGDFNLIQIKKLWLSYEFTSSSYVTSSAIDLNTIANSGYFSLQYQIRSASSPVVKFEYLESLDGINFVEPASASDIATVGPTSGPLSNGFNIVSFAPPPARWMKIRATETAGATGAMTVHLCIQ